MSIRINGQDVPSTINDPVVGIQHGTYYMADNPQLYEPQRGNNYEFIVTDLSNLRPSGDNTMAPTWPNAQEVLRLSVTSAAIPHYTQQDIAVRKGNSTLYFAGLPEFGEGSFAFNDFIGAQTKDILMAWQALSGNILTEKVGLQSDYKKEAYLIEYTPDWQIHRQWKMFGCWIKGISEDPYNSENGDKHNITATIRYDRAIIDMSGVLGGGAVYGA